MRGSPSCVIHVRRFRLWRPAIVVLVAASLATLGAWAALAPQASAVGARIVVALAATAILALGASLLRTPPVTLRWDGVGWSVFWPGVPALPPMPVELDVALDLGAFLLLRLCGRDAVGRRRVRWIPT